MIVREAEPRDDTALLRIESLSAQGDKIRLADERTSFFHRADKFERPIIMVGEDERTGAIRGVIAAAIIKVRVDGCYRTGAYVFDLRNNAETSSGLSRALFFIWKKLEARLLDEGVEFLYGLVKEDNARSLGIAMRLGATPRGEKKFITQPVVRRMAVRKQVQVAQDIDPLQDRARLEIHYKDHHLWPAMDDWDLLKRTYDNCVVAQLTCGRASVKLWDLSKEASQRVIKMPRTYEIAGHITRVLERLLPIPHIPKLGEEVRTWFAVDVIGGNSPAELNAVMAQANNMARDAGAHYLIAAVDTGDPESRMLRPSPLPPLRYKVMVLDYRPVPGLRGATYLDPRMM